MATWNVDPEVGYSNLNSDESLLDQPLPLSLDYI